ncbi:cytochrome c6 PetJ [Rivularia sp. UHCC 0363]|uniref:cytochrome c6 PetJ n=1 Tax=Rivularia sp. UHCC 0363 TaxID=3110244 RepID=UPI003A59919C
MKKILSIVFLVIPLLFFTYACGEETQATVAPNVEQVAPVEVKVVEKTQTVVKPVDAVKVAEEKPAVTSVKVTSEELAVKPVAMAASHEEGAKLFKQNCAACHAGGGNLVNAQKTLKKDALEKYDMYSKDAIIYQVVNGKNAMPAFGKRLSSEQIEQLAEYVLAQADKGW